MAEEAAQTGYQHTPFPQQVVIESTANCNQKCIFCGRTYMERPKLNMPRALFNKLVEEVARENAYAELWPAFMGESMLLGDRLFDALLYARQVGCKKITLNSNGTRLNEKTIPRLLEGGVDRFIISCDAHTPETHAHVRPARSKATLGLEGIYKGILGLLELMRQKNLKRPLLELQFSIFAENEHEAEAFQKFWLAQGVVVKVRPKVFWSGTVAGGQTRVAFTAREPCLWAMDTAAIHWNGNVVMCAIDCEGKYVAGNIEMQSLKEIWNGPLKWMRELHMRRRFSELPEICRKCPDWKVKKAHVFYPNDDVKKEYEAYLRLGRTFMERHYWKEPQAPSATEDLPHKPMEG